MKHIEYGADGSIESMRVVEAAAPRPASGEILIEVHYAGVNRPDISQRQGRYPPPPGASPILGLEVSGRVAALGENVSEWQVGDYIKKNLSLLRKDGRLVFIAFQQGSKTDFDFLSVMTKRLTITGSTMRPRSIDEKAAIRDALQRDVWPALAKGQMKVHLFAEFPLDEAGEAHRLMQSSEHVGKLILKVIE